MIINNLNLNCSRFNKVLWSLLDGRRPHLNRINVTMITLELSADAGKNG